MAKNVRTGWFICWTRPCVVHVRQICPCVEIISDRFELYSVQLILTANTAVLIYIYICINIICQYQCFATIQRSVVGLASWLTPALAWLALFCLNEVCPKQHSIPISLYPTLVWSICRSEAHRRRRCSPNAMLIVG